MKNIFAFVVFVVGLVMVPATAFSAVDFREGKASVVISSVTANSGGALIEWDVKNGDNIIGFNVYRVSAKQTVKVNPSVVGGSYVSTAIPADSRFSFFDRRGSVGAEYRIGVIEIGSKGYETRSSIAVYNNALRAPYSKEIESVGEATSKNAPAGHFYSSETQDLEGDLITQQWVASQPGVKIKVSKDGLVKVTRTELETAGFDIDGPAANWQLYFHGRQQAINVPVDGSYVEFFGKGLDTNETSQNCYFLLNGPVAGKRIGPRVIRRLRGPVESKNFSSIYSKTDRTLYTSTILNGKDSNFFAAVISPGGTTVNFDLDGFDSSSTSAEMTLEVTGLTLGLHEVNVVLNGVQLAPVETVNREKATKALQVSASALLETGNALTLNSTVSGSDFSLLGTILVDYSRRFEAKDEQLAFKTQNYRKTEITGFSSDSVRIFDVSEPDDAREVTNADVVETSPGSGIYKAVLPASRAINLYAVADTGTIQPDSIVINNPSTLSLTTNAADYLIITHPDFAPEANDWSTYRTADGFQTMVVDINDVFDEFSFGEVTAEATRSFLQYSDSNWQTDPDYVLLVGDGSYDPRNFEGNGAFNLMPVLLVDTLYEETPSDDSIADFNNDGLAEIAIGRIPARVLGDVTNALTKVTLFESSIATAQARGSACASDLPEGYDFEALCGRLHDELPASIPKVGVNRGDTDAKATLISTINAGQYIVNYSGHGSTGIWASTGFFGNADVPALTNAADPSLFTMLTCLNGYFARPVTDSLSELLLKSTSGGGVAVWSSSGSTTPDVQEVMAKRFFNQIGNGTEVRLGNLINDAKSTIIGGRDVRVSWALLGDPGLRVKPDVAARRAPKAGF